jgi:hypothetical protein
MDIIPASDIRLLAGHHLATTAGPGETYTEAIEWARSTVSRNSDEGRAEENLRLIMVALRAQNEALTTLLVSAISSTRAA